MAAAAVAAAAVAAAASALVRDGDLRLELSTPFVALWNKECYALCSHVP